jgi:anti-anti-sigma factor
VADRLAVARPFSPLCLYDTRRVADEGALPVVHPLNGPEQPPFTLSSTSVRAAALTGELDTFGADALAEVLEAMPTTDVLDVSALAFIDGSAARTLHGWLRRRRTAGDDIRVVGAGSLVRRTWDLCDLDPAALSLSA